MDFPALHRVKRAIRAEAGLVLAAVAFAACTDRERLTFPPSDTGVGPITFIDQPSGADTTVKAGRALPLSGKTIDPDGVDTLYIVVVGGNQGFQPFVLRQDTVRFGVTVNTTGLANQTMFILVFGTDQLGNRGDTAIRRVDVTP